MGKKSSFYAILVLLLATALFAAMCTDMFTRTR